MISLSPQRRNSPRSPVSTVAADFAQADIPERLVSGSPDVIFHLAAIVSGEAEMDFAKGYAVNLDGTRRLFDAVIAKGSGYCPRVVFCIIRGGVRRAVAGSDR